jgi:thiol:disulfide interchange protein
MILIGFIFIKSINRRNMLIKNSQDNWKWDDNWSTKKNILKKEINSTPKKTEPIEKKQITTVNFKEAIEKSKESKMNVLAFFVSDSCGFCQKLKKETLSDDSVKELMKNYIVVYIDADKDRGSIKKFKVTGLPTYIVLNQDEKQLQFGSGFLNKTQFFDWIKKSN